MNNLAKIIIIFLFLALTAAPLMSLAAPYDATKGLVPCGTTANPAPCNLCHLYLLIQNILDFLMFYIAPIIAVLAVAWGGFKILIAGEKPGLRAEGFKIIQTTVIGLAIMFAGWVVMNEAILFFGQKSTSDATIGSVQATSSSSIWLPWNKVKCETYELKK